MFTVYTLRFGVWQSTYSGPSELHAYGRLAESILPTVVTDGNGTPLAANSPAGFTYNTARKACAA
jgi:hypothetical protein